MSIDKYLFDPNDKKSYKIKKKREFTNNQLFYLTDGLITAIIVGILILIGIISTGLMTHLDSISGILLILFVFISMFIWPIIDLLLFYQVITTVQDLNLLTTYLVILFGKHFVTILFYKDPSIKDLFA